MSYAALVDNSDQSENYYFQSEVFRGKYFQKSKG